MKYSRIALLLILGITYVRRTFCSNQIILSLRPNAKCNSVMRSRFDLSSEHLIVVRQNKRESARRQEEHVDGWTDGWTE
jgi:hypothetical protein